MGRNYYFLIVIRLIVKGVSLKPPEEFRRGDVPIDSSDSVSFIGSDIGKIYFPVG